MNNIFFAVAIILCFSCEKIKKEESATNHCNAPVALAAIDTQNFKGQYFYIDSFWVEGKNVHVKTRGSCVSEPKNTALLYEQNLISSFHPDYKLYLADTVRNDFTIDCFATKPMTLCFALEKLMLNTPEARFKLYNSPEDTLLPKQFILRR